MDWVGEQRKAQHWGDGEDPGLVDVDEEAEEHPHGALHADHRVDRGGQLHFGSQDPQLVIVLLLLLQRISENCYHEGVDDSAENGDWQEDPDAVDLAAKKPRPGT